METSIFENRISHNQLIMAGAKDILNFGVIQKKSNKDSVTPHKIAVVLLIREFCSFKNKVRTDQMHKFDDGTRFGLEPHYKRDFCTLVLKLIQCPDLELHELQAILTSGNYNLLPLHLQNFNQQLMEIHQNGVGSILDLIQNLSRLIVEPTHMVAPVVHKSSIIGLYIRRIMILFDKLSFSQVVGIYQTFKQYYEKYINKHPPTDVREDPGKSGTDIDFSISIDQRLSIITEEPIKQFTEKELGCFGATNSNTSNNNSGRVCWSRRQAELFIAQQATLIQTNELAALPPPELQDRIRELLRANPEYAEAHFLSYLNCLRVKEFCGAMDSLFHCFDRNSLVSDNKISSLEEKSRGYRYAALNLAILLAKFNHKKEALYALKEAIMMAHEANDNVCLQHALAWLYKLGDDNKEILMERSISKSSDLSLSYLTSLGIQSFAQFAGVTGGKPALVYDLSMKSDVLNCQHSMIDLMTNSYAQKAALWSLYGKSEMSMLSSQLLLHLNTSNPTQGVQSFNGEGTCQALCNVANTLTEEGEYNLASQILVSAKERFPHETHSHAWIFSEQILAFTKAMHHEKWQIAENAVTSLEAIDKWESKLRRAELCVAKGDFPGADEHVHNVLDYCRQHSEAECVCPSLRVRALILAAELQSSCATTTSAPSGAISLLTTALALAQLHYLDYLAALIGLHLANIQLQMKLPSQALKLINQSLLVILSHGSCYDQGRALLLFAKCKVAAASGKSAEQRKGVLIDAVNMLKEVKISFQKIEAYGRVKDVVYLQALLYNEINYDSERNKCALEFRLLDEQYPTKIATTLLTRL
ncbi:Anaphase-promoting complex subunit 5 [Blattella germanica]|nr:Anaphase-promoting complex subunit 5 [Blattella germanica]